MMNGQVHVAARRRFDISYLLLFPFVAIAVIPWLKYRVPFRLLLPLPIVWFLLNAGRVSAYRLSKRCVGYMAAALVLLTIITFRQFFYSLLEQQIDLPGTSELIDTFVVVLGFVIIHISINHARFRELRVLLLFTLGCLAVSAVTNIVGLSGFEEGSRVVTAQTNETIRLEDLQEAREAGIAGFGYIYGMGFLIFPLVVAARGMKIRYRVFVYCVAMLFALVVLRARYSILVLAQLIGMLAMVLSRRRVSGGVFSSVMVGVMTALVIVLVNPTVLQFLSPILVSLGDMVNDNNYQFRLSSLNEAVMGGQETYAIIRSNLYWDSWRLFTKAPFVGFAGTMDKSVFDSVVPGAHSFIFDVLGCYGLIGAVVYALFFWNCHRYFKEMARSCRCDKPEHLFSTFFYSFVFVSFLNPIWGYPILIDYVFLVPGLLFLRKPRRVIQPFPMAPVR